MHRNLFNAPQFYVTPARPCPYLSGRIERIMFTKIEDDNNNELNNILSKQGFRRLQNILYRPCCTACNACISVRVRVADFVPRRSHRRIRRKNAKLLRQRQRARATKQQYRLFVRYLRRRHAGGGMEKMNMNDYRAMVEHGEAKKEIIEYYVDGDVLVAVSLVDIMNDGLSMIYSFFNPDKHSNSLGIYMILDHIKLAQDMGLRYIYLGYWVAGSKKMAYKIQFSPLEGYFDNRWRHFSTLKGIDLARPLRNHEPMYNQITTIKLPNMRL